MLNLWRQTLQGEGQRLREGGGLVLYIDLWWLVGPREQQNNNTFVAYLHRREPGASSRRCPLHDCRTHDSYNLFTYL
jgi:hypothetical protein